MATSPIQTSFAGGEVSPRICGRVDTDLYAHALALCRNWQPLPQGSLRMRAGTGYAGSTATKPRLIAFNVSGADPYELVLTDRALRIRSRAGASLTFLPNLLVNGAFHAGMEGWTSEHPADVTWQVGGFVRIGGVNMEYTLRQTNIAVTPGVLHRIKVRVRGVSAAGHARVAVFHGGVVYDQDVTLEVATQWTTLTVDFTPAASPVTFLVADTDVNLDVDDAEITCPSATAGDHLVAPWTADQLAAIQFDQDLTKNRMMLVHPNVAPQLLSISVHGTWEFGASPFTDPPPSWGGANWPAAIDWGFQGRLWLGGTPDEPNTFWGSASGLPFKFTTGLTTPSDPVSFNASVRGALRWLQGQKVLLLGAERVEQSAASGNSVIAPGNPPDVRDESAFGSAAIQAIHIGDQALWVTRDRRHVRAMDYNFQTNGWVSKALSFAAEHLTVGGLKEIAFARSPEPTLFGLRTDGALIACTHDRAEQVLAWWRITFAGDPVVNSMCVVDTEDGCELRLSLERPGGEYLEHLPLHETGIGYLDAAVTAVAGGGQLAGLAHLEGLEVTMVTGGAVLGTGTVAGGAVACGAADGTSVTVGLGYRATARTLPREVKTGKARDAKVGVLLNDSAVPLLNGWRAEDRTPATPQDRPEARRSGRVYIGNLGWSDDGVVTIEQDLPVRTEVLAVFAVTSQDRT